ncbi:MAG: dihydroorotate dehydrogenase electron transfer subunit [Bacillota bacterium]|nr:dihydroorotate dehydrogenase electron transfer subunit [Bacillota bacterium]
MVEHGTILTNENVGQDIWRMEISAPEIATLAVPGQFVNVRLHDRVEPLLRRPISLHGIDSESGTIAFLYLVVGKGTEMMTKMEPGKDINLLGPLGRGFSLDFEGERAVVIGGGIGSAPLYPLVRALRAKGKEVTLILGARSKESIVALNLYKDIGATCKIATEDGSLGVKGFVTAVLEEELKSGSCDYLYTCGPIPMLRAIETMAAQYGVKGEISTEAHMGCGLGLCLSCSVRGRDGRNRKVCQAGPVFRLGELSYD